MKINNIFYLLLLLIGSSCSDQFLKDMENYEDTDASFYQSETRVNWYMADVFYNCFSGYSSPAKILIGSYTDMYSKMTEEYGGLQTYIKPTLEYKSAEYGSSYYGSKLADKIQNNPYTRIRNCTELITTIDEKGSDLDSDFRDGAKGQMYFVRALQYLDLMRVYGGVPIITTLETASSTDESIKHPRASVPDLVIQIVSDLDSAAALLPSYWDSGEDNYGRYTKGAALAEKTRVLLTYASPLFNTDWDNAGNERWTKALAAGLEAETELTAAGYGLYGSSAKDWEDMFNIDNSFCSEAIIVQLFASGDESNKSNNSWENDIRLSSQNGDGGISAPKEIIDLFPMADGSRPTTENGYDETLFFLNRDPRFYRTFAFSGSKWGYSENDESTVWFYHYKVESGDDTITSYSDGNSVSSLAVVRKMTDVAESNELFEYSGKDIFEYRYAELLLTIAECYAATGDIANCIEYLGRVRNRVGIPSANNYGIGTLSDKYEALEACLYERRVELAYEGKRYWDIQRWMLYNDDSDYNNNTCEKLGINPINGTQRTGRYLTYNKVVATDVDPLDSVRDTISVDPDSDDFLSELQDLAIFYTDNFTREDLGTPMDNVNGEAAQIDFKSNYYIMGLYSSILTQNTWLEQTKGWEDVSGADGTYDYQAE